jgi:hypothetical protein
MGLCNTISGSAWLRECIFKSPTSPWTLFRSGEAPLSRFDLIDLPTPTFFLFCGLPHGPGLYRACALAAMRGGNGAILQSICSPYSRLLGARLLPCNPSPTAFSTDRYQRQSSENPKAERYPPCLGADLGSLWCPHRIAMDPRELRWPVVGMAMYSDSHF